MNTLSLMLLVFGGPAAVVVCQMAARQRMAKAVPQLPILNRRQEQERSASGPRPGGEKISGKKDPEPVPAGGNRHILFVDDERQFAERGRATLKELGYRVTLVADANEALAIIRDASEKIDCVITDLSMPGMSGFDLARICQRLLPGVPVILMSSQYGPIASELLQACGIYAQLVKPFTQRTLAEAVHRVLTGGEAGAGLD